MKHSKYKKPIPRKMRFLDVYRVCRIFEVKDDSGALQHALKKLLCPGQRGVKGRKQDIQEAIDSLQALLQMESEFEGEENAAKPGPTDQDVDTTITRLYGAQERVHDLMGEVAVRAAYEAGRLCVAPVESRSDPVAGVPNEDIVRYMVAQPPR